MPAVAVQPFGVADVSYVARVDVPRPCWWRLAITVSRGQPAPTTRTPILADVGGNILELTTDPAPDRRLHETSAGDALAAHQPFVVVIDSTKFRTTPACGKALVMARYLRDRWTQVPFIHLEPFEFTLISDTPVLLGPITDPTLVPAVEAWGIGPEPWTATSMPWISSWTATGSSAASTATSSAARTWT